MTPTVSRDLLHALAEHFGIATEFTNWQGQTRPIEPDTLIAVLAALDIDASSDETATVALEKVRQQHWRNVVPATVVTRKDTAAEILVHVPAGADVNVNVELETGQRIPLTQLDHLVPNGEIDGVCIGEAKFLIPATLPIGWHTIIAELDPEQLSTKARETLNIVERRRRGAANAVEGRGTLICAPNRTSVSIAEKQWGLMAQLYQARSSASWGVGDLADLATLGEWGASRGADFVLVNPFHAPSPVTPLEPSPYLPSTRRFLDPNLIRIDELVTAEPVTVEVGQRLAELAAFCRQNHERDVIDRDGTWSAKREALSLCFAAAGQGNEQRWREFGEFCESEGQALVNFATWCVLSEQFGGNWRDWPEAYQHPSSPEVDEFRQQHAERVEFYCWVQWVVREQGARTQQRLTEAGMRIGVVHDLAVGVHPSGADAWAMHESLARGVCVGAPPDQFNQLGQNWSQPPLRPDALERLGYQPLREVLRAAFHGAGAVRIDHILGMFRQWWVPEGHEAAAGTYIRFNHEAMISVVLLEAERAGALVIGEDLGVVSDITRQVMADRHVFGTQIMWFEFEPDGSPKHPEHYRRECLATVTTHDLPPTAGYLELTHVAIRQQLGLLTRPVEQERAAEQQLLDAYRQALVDADLLSEDAGCDDLVLALHRRLAASRSLLFGVSLADLAQDRRPINQPGTYREYPNWTRPLAGPDGEVLLLEDVLDGGFADALAQASLRRDG